jgi:hypothetical protein
MTYPALLSQVQQFVKLNAKLACAVVQHAVAPVPHGKTVSKPSVFEHVRAAQHHASLLPSPVQSKESYPSRHTQHSSSVRVVDPVFKLLTSREAPQEKAVPRPSVSEHVAGTHA